MVFNLTINNFSEGACRRHFCSLRKIIEIFGSTSKYVLDSLSCQEMVITF
ncbi:hypothetical protein CDLVIII_4763 [Clostridium sp. DL-VIII]|nr:hypothetical protein CDLVIII_4763 [Clostridium sp. DL-VIII]